VPRLLGHVGSNHESDAQSVRPTTSAFQSLTSQPLTIEQILAIPVGGRGRRCPTSAASLHNDEKRRALRLGFLRSEALRKPSLAELSGYSVVKDFIGLLTPSLLPLESIESTV
jgi:hypothetical protein